MRSTTWRWALGLATALLLTAVPGCGDEEAPEATNSSMTRTSGKASRGENRAPRIESVRLSPEQPIPGQPVRALIASSDPDHDPVRLTITWIVNERPVQVGASAQLALPDLRSGDRIEVEVVASDGSLESDPYRMRSEAKNRPPTVRSVFLEPGADVRPGQSITALVDAFDVDDDPLRVEYTWVVNDREMRDGEKTFATDKLRRGDKLRVRVVASDGTNRSSSEESAEIVLANSPPIFTGVPPIEEEGGIFRYKLSASDPDGDRNLRFHLEEGPTGMSVDPLSGVARWQPTATQAGEHVVEVAVRDGGGAEARLRWSVNVAVEKPARGASPAAAAP